MKIEKPNVEIVKEENRYKHVHKCARICYGKEGEPEGDSRNFVKAIINRGHTSMLRHSSRYFFIPYGNRNMTMMANNIACSSFVSVNKNKRGIGLVTNSQYIIELKNRDIMEYEISEKDYARKFGKKSIRYSIIVTTQIGTTRELNRVSPNNIAERSTRYCSSRNGIDICEPYFWKDIDWKKKLIYKFSWKCSEIAYKILSLLGVKPEDARAVLPLETLTKAVYTYTYDEWMHIIDLRMKGTTGKPHPDCQLIASLINKKLEEELS